jgi:CRP/FNR family transcriptional regulator, nitrogen oxide reductase regulator
MTLSPAEIQISQSTVLLDGLHPSESEVVLRASQVKTLNEGAFFFMESDPAEKAFVLITGKVKLVQVTTDGQQVILGYLVPGRIYGIIAILKKVTYPVSAQAVGDCKAIFWDRDTLNRLMEQYPRIALNALRIMSGQIRQFQNTVKDLSTKRVEQRVARAVLRLARQSGRKIDSGVLIDLPLSRQDLAEMTGTTLYTVSRVLKEWEKNGLVQSKRQQVIITFPHGLVAIAEDLPDTRKIHPNLPNNLCDL